MKWKVINAFQMYLLIMEYEVHLKNYTIVYKIKFFSKELQY